ncbi:MAG: ThuA domain-containing protein [Verrucomicrobiota bacterium]
MKEPHELLRVAVVTGGHPFDVVGFQDFWSDMPGVKCYIQHLEHYCSSSEKEQDRYEAVVFYNMTDAVPSDKEQPWWKGAPETALRRMTKKGVGVVIWHHALVAFPGWEFWDLVCGHSRRTLKPHFDQEVNHSVQDVDHPILRGLPRHFSLIDETYEMAEPEAEGNHVLLTTDHPDSLRSQVWLRECGESRVLCLIPGHDHHTWNAPEFRQLFSQGIQWVARRRVL